ncbi:MAG TPA: helix-turn-helix domain-containing protein [Candidatus Dormibacteraeota bacterium]|nr:helix-turn-helix domain-containing protein [Candidatus Dormibacteraeota bacterium]
MSAQAPFPEAGAITLAALLRRLGPGVLQVLAAPSGDDVPVAAPAIHDAGDPPHISRGTLLLGVGLAGGRELAGVLQRVAEEGAVLLVKAAPAHAAATAEDARRLGATVLAVPLGATWVQILSLLRSAMTDDVSGGRDELGGVAGGDLFAVANAVAALIDAPVTIEDPQSRVIAYSARQDEADEARMQTILGRQVPDDFARAFQTGGLYRRLHSEGGPMYLDGLGPDVLPRLAVAVKAGDELLGSMWAAVRRRPSQERIDDFVRAAGFVAIHLLRHRITADAQRGLQNELMSLVLGGGPVAEDAASRLGLAGDGFRVVAAGMREGDAVDNQLALARLWDTLSLHLSVIHRRSASAVVEGVVYAVIPVRDDADASRLVARTAADGFLARLNATLRRGVAVAIGGHAAGLAEIPRSRRDADRVLRVVRRSADVQARPADIEDMHMQVLLDRLGDVAADEPISPVGPLRILLERDAKQSSHLIETLRAYLDAFGDVGVAAQRLDVHPNTLRYRIERLREIPGLDLSDAEQRLALQLQLRWLPRTAPAAPRRRASRGHDAAP